MINNFSNRRRFGLIEALGFAIAFVLGVGIGVLYLVPESREIARQLPEVVLNPLAFMQHGDGQKDSVQTQVKALSQVCDQFRIKNERLPKSLQEMIVPDPFGCTHINNPAHLIDPWGQSYQYDSRGPNNLGLHADIWTVAPDGDIIGNWPRKR